MSQALVAGVAAGAAVVLYGCGGGGDNTTTPGPDQTTTPEVTTTTTTTTSTAMPGLICQPDAGRVDAAACAASLNQAYVGFDESDDASPLGVPIRGRARFDENGEWYFCTGKCFDNGGNTSSQPDCYTPGGLINHKVVVTEDGQLPSATNSKSGTNGFFSRYPVLVVLQPSTALQRLTKCAWQFDGAAFNRQNGGCGMGEPGKCGDDKSPFDDKCPDDPTKWADETCATTMQAYCANESVDYNNTCFWKGPAFSSPVYPGAKPDFDFADFQKNDEIRKMLKNRVSDGHQDGQTSDQPPIPLLEYWNEITMDGRIIDRFIQTQGLQSVVAAFAFARGNGDDIDAGNQVQAQKFVDYFQNASNATIPLLALDTRIGNAPFVVVGDTVVV